MANDECKIEVLEHLSLRKLIEAADENEGCSKVAAEVFERKFTKYAYKIEKNPNPNESTISQMSSSDGGSKMEISGLELSTRLIKHFGHLIQNITIYIDVGKSNCQSIRVNETIDFFEAINSHCRESLLEFKLRYDACDANHVFNQIKGPFKQVQMLALDIQNMTKQAKKRQLDAIFPNVHSLQLELNPLKDFAFIGCNLPKLETLMINYDSYEFDKQIIIDLLKNNPQISKLVLLSYSPEMLGYFEKYLTNLQMLMLGPNQNDEDINFLLKFSRLQSLTFTGDLKNAQLLELIGNHPKLWQATIPLDKDVSEDTIIRFIKQSPSLNLLTIGGEKVSADMRAIERRLVSALDTDFHIQSADSEIPALIIIRRVPAPNSAYSYNNAVCNTFAMITIAHATRYFLL